jgi:hypothetical protein
MTILGHAFYQLLLRWHTLMLTTYQHVRKNYTAFFIQSFFLKQTYGRDPGQLTEMHGPCCAYCHQYILDSELSVDHIVLRASYGVSIVRNMQLLCDPFDKMKDQPSTKLIQMNASIIKVRILLIIISRYQIQCCLLRIHICCHIHHGQYHLPGQFLHFRYHALYRQHHQRSFHSHHLRRRKTA